MTGALSVTALDPDDVLLVLQSAAWDEDWYRQEYPDVPTSGVDPLLHYLTQGWRELRSPGPLFDAQWYADAYLAGVRDQHPLLHFLEHGVAQGLLPRSTARLSSSGTTPAAHPPPLLAEASIREQQWRSVQAAIDEGDVEDAASILEGMVRSWERDWRARITLSWCLTALGQHDRALVVWAGPQPPRSLAEIPAGRIRVRAALAERALGFPRRAAWPVVEYQRRLDVPESMRFHGLVENELMDARVADDVVASSTSGPHVVLGLAADLRSVLIGRVASKRAIRDAPFARVRAVRESSQLADVPIEQFLEVATVTQRQRFILNSGRVGSTLLVRMLREAGVDAISELEMHRAVALAVDCGELDLSQARVLSTSATASVLDEPCDLAVVKVHASACSSPAALMADTDDAVVLWRAVHPWFLSWMRASRGDRSMAKLVELLENVVRAQLSAAEEGRLRGVLWYENLCEGRLDDATKAFDDVLRSVPLRTFEGDAQVGTPLSRESLSNWPVPGHAWQEFAEAWGRSPAFALARDLGLDGLVDGIPNAARGPSTASRRLVLPWHARGSVEHYYHFLLGYLLPLARQRQRDSHQHDRRADPPLLVRDCGPMNRILREFEGRWQLSVLPPGQHREDGARRNASYVVGMDSWSRYEPDAIRASTQAVREALGMELLTSATPRGRTILVIERGTPDPFYGGTAAEVKTSGVDRRSVPNLRDVAESLEECGEVTILQLEEMSLAEQVRAFEQADIIVAQHGAALANLVWCRPGTGVVEIDPTRGEPYFSSLASSVGCHHRRVIQQTPHSPVSSAVVRAAVAEIQGAQKPSGR